MCLLERQTPFFSPYWCVGQTPTVLEPEQTGYSGRAAKDCKTVRPPVASLVSEEALNCNY